MHRLIWTVIAAFVMALVFGPILIPWLKKMQIRPDDLRPRAGIPQEEAGHAHHGRRHLRPAGPDRRGGVRHLRAERYRQLGRSARSPSSAPLGFGAGPGFVDDFIKVKLHALAGPDPQAEAGAAGRVIARGAGRLAPIKHAADRLPSSTVPILQGGRGTWAAAIHPGDDLRPRGHGQLRQPAGRRCWTACWRAARCSIASPPWRSSAWPMAARGSRHTAATRFSTPPSSPGAMAGRVCWAFCASTPMPGARLHGRRRLLLHRRRAGRHGCSVTRLTRCCCRIIALRDARLQPLRHHPGHLLQVHKEKDRHGQARVPHGAAAPSL